ALGGEDFLTEAVGDAKVAVVGKQRQPLGRTLAKVRHVPVGRERAEAGAVGEVGVVSTEKVIAELAGDDPGRVGSAILRLVLGGSRCSAESNHQGAGDRALRSRRPRPEYLQV